MTNPISAPLVLRSLTLRGVGSYLHGQRLDLRPLTILCGKNGSGKSTWLNALALLKRSLPQLPFAFHGEDAPYLDPYTNAVVGMAENPGQRRALASPQQEAEFGPFGTIGLVFETTMSLSLPAEAEGDAPTTDIATTAHQFLWSGRCPASTRFQLRLAHPKKWFDDDQGEELFDLVELRINNDAILRFQRLVDWEGSTSILKRGDGRRNDPYSFRWSAQFLGGAASDLAPDSLQVVPHVRPNHCTLEFEASSDPFRAQRRCAELAAQRIRELLSLLLAGYFHIGAVRSLCGHRTQESASGALEAFNPANRDELVAQRYVGRAGEGTLALLQAFAYNLMRQSHVPFSGHLAQEFPRDTGALYGQVGQLLRRASEEPVPSAVGRIWNLTNPELLRQLQDQHQLRASGDYDQSLLLSWADVLNEVLSRRDLYRPDLWPVLNSEEAKFWISQGVERLSEEELRRLNRLLIEEAFGRIDGIPHQTGYVFEMFVGVWLEKLIQTQISPFPDNLEGQSLSEQWDKHAPPPDGFLVHDRPKWMPVGPDWHPQERLGEAPYDKEGRFQHECLGNLSPSRELPAPPSFLSAGFQQIAPIVVQAGLLKAHEVMAVENPEVHLHPSLQLEITGFLLAQARSGKTVLVETHSDLVVRRVLRAILQEEIAQAQVQIAFASLTKDAEQRVAWSTLERVQVNERGQVANWPEGFMDDDIRESRRLIDIMYGAIPEENDE